jgi:hypothetical protein
MCCVRPISSTIRSIAPRAASGYGGAVRWLTLTLSLWLLAACGGAPPAPPPDPRVVALLDGLLDALARDDTAAAVPLLHANLLTEDGTALDPQVARYAWKKAAANAPLYVRPPVIVSTRDEGEAPGAGRQVRYFLEKKPAVEGMPAPVTVVWPDGGGPPKVLYFGGL